MKLRPIVDYENPPAGPLLDALLHYEARCQMQGLSVVEEADVRHFLEAEYPAIASDFRASHLRPF